jgi:phospholipase C
MRRRSFVAAGAAVTLLALSQSGIATADGRSNEVALRKIDHIVVIYEENHSFDNLYGGWEGVDGHEQAGPGTQVNVVGQPYNCLKQDDVNLASPPVAVTCDDATPGNATGAFASGFTNGPFSIEQYIPATAKTCPPALKAFSFPNGVLNGDPQGEPGGCTRDLVHKFYQEQYQIDGGRMDRYATGSDAGGLVMGSYDTTQLPIYRYLHAKHAPDYAIADRFFQAAFGGSYLNHQWLIAARTPVYTNAPTTLHSIIDADGFPNPNTTGAYPLRAADATLRDSVLTVAPNADGTCPTPARVCGDYSINTQEPATWPTAPFAPALPLQNADTIGDRLSAKGIDWAWYSGGWDNATGNTTGAGWTNGAGPSCSDPETAAGMVYPKCANNVFQYHHQPFTYFAKYAEGTPGRAAHLADEEAFIAAAKHGQLKPVSFVKPLGQENEHPGYASESNGSNHLVDLIEAIESGPDAKRTMIVVTYDEFGGQWDHVAPPTGRGVSDAFGPGTRVPALIIAKGLPKHFSVDHTMYDTTSILTTIEHRFDLKPLGTRDAAVNDLSNVFHPVHGH